MRIFHPLRNAPVALLYSNDSRRGIESMPFLVSQPAGDMPWSRPDGYDLVMRRMYRALYDLNAGIDFVIVREKVTDIEDYLQVADIGLYTSETESFCLSILEAMAEIVDRHLRAAIGGRRG